MQAGTLALVGAGAHTPVLNNTNASAYTDVQGGRLVLDYTGGSSPAAQVLGVLDAGYDQTPRFSNGIIRSTTADATTALGWRDDGQKVIIARTYFGDADLNGQVDVADLGLLASNWQAGVGSPLGPSFAEALASVGLGSVAVPEPASTRPHPPRAPTKPGQTVMRAGIARRLEKPCPLLR